MTAQCGVVMGRHRGSLLSFLALCVAWFLAPFVTPSPPARAADQGISDGDGLIVADGILYSLDLETAVASALVTLSGVTPEGGVPALEADPSADTVVALDQAGGNSEQLLSIDATTGLSSRVGSRFVGAEAFQGIARTDSGVTYVSGAFDDGQGNLVNQIATLDVDSRALSPIGPTTASGASTLLGTLFSVGDTLYGFRFLDTASLYEVDTDTGALTAVGGFSSTVQGRTVVGADTAADGTVYLITADSDSAWLSRTDLVSTTEIGVITGTVALVENLAIATLLDTERTPPEPRSEPEPQSEKQPEDQPERRDSSDDEESAPPVVAAAPAQPELAPTGVGTLWGVVSFVMLIVGGVVALAVSRIPASAHSERVAPHGHSGSSLGADERHSQHRTR